MVITNTMRNNVLLFPLGVTLLPITDDSIMRTVRKVINDHISPTSKTSCSTIDYVGILYPIVYISSSINQDNQYNIHCKHYGTRYP